MRRYVALISMLAVLLGSVPVRGATTFEVGSLTFSSNTENGLNVIFYDSDKNAPDYELKIAGVYEKNSQKYLLKEISDGVFAHKKFSYVYIENVSGLAIGAGSFRGARVGEIAGSSITKHKFEITGSNGRVTEIGDKAFSEMQVEGDVTITGLDDCSVGRAAFQNLKANGEIRLTGSVDTLGDYAFAGVSADNIVIPKGIRHFGDGVFQGVGILNFVFDEEVESLGSRIFEGCEELKTITLPQENHLTSVAEDAFPDKEDLTIIVPNDQTDLSAYHFEKHPHLIFQTEEDIAADSPVMQFIIENDLMYKQGENGKIISPGDPEYPMPGIDTPGVEKPLETEGPLKTALPSESPSAGPSETSLPSEMALPTIEPLKTEEPSKTALPPQTALQTAIVPPVKEKEASLHMVKQIKYRIQRNNTVSVAGYTGKVGSRLRIPNTVQIDGRLYKVVEIEAKAFQKNQRIKKVVLGNFVAKVGKKAFAGCGKLTEIRFGTGMVRLGEQALKGDRRLKKIVFRGNKLKTIGKKAFRGVPKSVDIIVSKKKAKYYKKLINRSNA